MKIKRKQFIRRILSFTAGSLLLPPAFLKSGEAEAGIIPGFKVFKPDPGSWNPEGITLSWLGQSTILMNFFGTVILTDPVLCERFGVYILGLTFGPNRYTPPALHIKELPKPDLVLLSHAHLDHMDYETLKDITEKFPEQIDCITAYNTKDVIDDLKWRSLKELDWNERISIDNLNIRALEVKHFGWRYPWEKDRSQGYLKTGRSYNAYIIEKKERRILFGGDTAYTELFSRTVVKPVDIAIMPIGAYNPWKKYHCNPEEALKMASLQMKAEYFIPIHCSTFKQGDEPVDEPVRRLLQSSPNYPIKIGLNEIGATFNHPTG